MFRFAHATHPDWRAACEMVLAQLEGQLQLEQFAPAHPHPQRVGLVYLTDAYSEHAQTITALLQRKTGFQDWVGAVATGICATGAEYFQEPAMAVMLLELPPDSARVFSGRAPLPKPGLLNKAGRDAMAFALVHVDPMMEDIEDLAGDLAGKITDGNVFGGLVSAQLPVTQIANGFFEGGVSGMLLSDQVPVEVRLTQGVVMLPQSHVVTEAKGQFVLGLDGQSALDVLLQDLGIERSVTREKDMERVVGEMAARFSNGIMVALRPAQSEHTAELLKFAGVKPSPEEYRVRPVVGLDPTHRAIALADHAQVGEALVFCSRDEAAARADLVRMCAELREELDAPAPNLNQLQSAGFTGISGKRSPKGAVYVACNGRGGAMFGHQGQELQLIREQLGDIPLVGFFANGEIRGPRLFGFTGVLTLFF